MADDESAPLELGGDVHDAAHVTDVLVVGDDDPPVIGVTFLPRRPPRILLPMEPVSFNQSKKTNDKKNN